MEKNREKQSGIKGMFDQGHSLSKERELMQAQRHTVDLLGSNAREQQEVKERVTKDSVNFGLYSE